MQNKILMANILNALAFSAPEPAEKSQYPLTGKKIAMIIAERFFHDREFAELKIIVEHAGAEVIIASNTLSEATGTLGLKIKPDILISEILVKNFSAVVFIGGPGCLRYSLDRQAHLIAKSVPKHRKILAAIGLATFIIVDAGLLKGEIANGISSYYIMANDVTVTENEVRRLGNVIVANGSGAVTKFGEEIIFSLSK